MAKIETTKSWLKRQAIILTIIFIAWCVLFNFIVRADKKIKVERSEQTKIASKVGFNLVPLKTDFSDIMYEQKLEFRNYYSREKFSGDICDKLENHPFTLYCTELNNGVVFQYHINPVYTWEEIDEIITDLLITEYNTKSPKIQISTTELKEIGVSDFTVSPGEYVINESFEK